MEISDIVSIMDSILRSSHVPEVGGIIQPGGNAKIHKLAFALDWDPQTQQRVVSEGVDGIWLHRISRRDPPVFPGNLTVFCHHAAFDYRYGFAGNLDLQAELGTLETVSLSERPALSIARLESATNQDELVRFLKGRFGGLERNYGKSTSIGWIALADAMRPELIAAAVSAGAQAYLTGQWRPSAEEAAAESGLSVIAVGHALIERRGLVDFVASVTKRCPNLNTLAIP